MKYKEWYLIMLLFEMNTNQKKLLKLFCDIFDKISNLIQLGLKHSE